MRRTYEFAEIVRRACFLIERVTTSLANARPLAGGDAENPIVLLGMHDA